MVFTYSFSYNTVSWVIGMASAVQNNLEPAFTEVFFLRHVQDPASSGIICRK